MRKVLASGVTLGALAAALLLSLGACSRAPTPSPSPTAPPAPSLQPVPPGALVIVNGTVIDGTGAAPLANSVVVIVGDRIASVGRAAGYAIPPDAVILDAKGGTILPGIINAHVHGASNAAIRRVRFLLKGIQRPVGAPGCPGGRHGADPDRAHAVV